MVRSLMVFFGLCLGVAASGCFFEEGGSGGSGGGGGMATGACTNAQDTAFVCDAGFSTTLTTCATDASGQGAATAECLVVEGLSSDCADCYGGATQCTFDNCLDADGGNCANDPTGDACTTCREMNCTPAFDACTGEVDCSGGGSGGSDGGGGGGGNDGGTGGGGGNGGGNGGAG